jgi:hypothetical protein
MGKRGQVVRHKGYFVGCCYRGEDAMNNIAIIIRMNEATRDARERLAECAPHLREYGAGRVDQAEAAERLVADLLGYSPID